jgi:hypothetical protein
MLGMRSTKKALLLVEKQNLRELQHPQSINFSATCQALGFYGQISYANRPRQARREEQRVLITRSIPSNRSTPVSSTSLLAVCTSDLSDAIQHSNGVKKELAEPYADTTLFLRATRRHGGRLILAAREENHPCAGVSRFN